MSSRLIKAEPLGGRLRRVRCKGGGLAFYSPLRLYNNSIIAEKRKRDTYIRDVIDLLYVDKTLRDLVNGKLEVKRERN